MSTTIDRGAASTHFDRPIHHTAHGSNGVGKMIVAVVLIAVVAGGGYFGYKTLTSPSTGPNLELVPFEVKKQDLDILVVERGSLESSKNIDLMCEVEARSPNSPSTTILSIVKEGTEVKKGELLVELDSASLKDQITAQQLKVDQGRASLVKAETDLEITKSQNESDIKAAEIAVDIAEIDLRKYLEGDYEQEKRNIGGEILISEEELQRANERLEYSERLLKKNYVSSSEVEADKLSVTKSKNSLAVAKEKLRVLDEYTKPRQNKDLGSKLDEARRKLDRVRNESKAKEAQADSTLLTQKSAFTTEDNTLKKFERQLDKCKLYAPADGMVVYANDPNSMMRGQSQVQIEEGASVRERQKIIRIPDLDDMQVNVKVHEAKVAHVKPGQQGKVKVESMPDRLFVGTVKTVATTADSGNWFSSGVQVYTVMVAINEKVEGLKPGMTAEVEVLADRITDVVVVPVQAVVERQGQNYCYLFKGQEKSPSLHRVKIGPSNDKMVMIESGISEHDIVVQNIQPLLHDKDREAELERVAKDDAETYKDEKPVVKLAATKAPENGGGAARPATNGNAGGPGARGPGGGAPGQAGPGGEGRPGGGAGGFANFKMPENGVEWIKDRDKNKDGKVAKDEVSGFEQAFFDRMDTNSDGFVDEAEADVSVKAMKERMKQFQEQGGGAPGGGAPGGGFPGGGRAPGGVPGGGGPGANAPGGSQ